MLHAHNDIKITSSKGPQDTLESTMYFLIYAASNHDTEIIYRKSEIILRVDNDVSYLVTHQDRSGSGGYHYLVNKEGTVFIVTICVLVK